MDFFTWPQIPAESYRADLVPRDDVTPLWIPDTQNNTWQWGESCSTGYIEHPHSLPFGDSAINSPDSFQSSESFPGSSYAGSNFGASPQEPQLEFELPSDLKAAGRPRAPVKSGSRDPKENRIQRRRTQNRNSQRVYRQRRIEERNVFEARATAAEETSAKLRSQVNELESEVAVLTEQIKGLEVENAALRTSSSPMIRTGSSQE